MDGISRFNIRVYGLLIHENKVLLADEVMGDYSFTKFPGGGLEYGEGLADGLKREFQEELAIKIELAGLFYINEFFQQSAFKKSDQLVSVYYQVKTKAIPEIDLLIKKGYREVAENHRIRFRWRALSEISIEELTFPVDKVVIEKLASSF